MIKIDSFGFTYEGCPEGALNDISLTIEDGECVLLTGHTGSGKSTLLMAICGLIPHVAGGVISGSISVDGIIPGSVPLRQMTEKAAMVFQDPGVQIFMPTVEEEVLFGCGRQGLSPAEASRRCDEALQLTGLSGERKKGTDLLSGGMKQRLAIASVYMMDPDVFLFDEPMADLDECGRKGFLEIIGRLKGLGKTIVIAEHRTEYLMNVTDRIIVLQNGIVAAGTISAGVNCFPARDIRVLNKGTVTVGTSGLFFSYNRDRRPVFEDLCFDIYKGEMVALTGDNGAGKTTLLKIMAGLLPPVRGSVSILGMINPGIEELIGRVGFLFQNPDEQLFESTVEREILFGPRNMGRDCDVYRYLSLAGLEAIKGRHPQELSRGQRQLVATMSVLAMEPDILLLDEPTTGLDETTWRSFFAVLEAMAAEGRTIIYSTHSMKAKNFADRAIVLDGCTMVLQ